MEEIKRINLNEEYYKVTDEEVRTKYPTLDDLPTINGKQVVGDLTLSQLGIQPQGEYARYTEVPQRVSELSNDLLFQTRTQVQNMIMDELANFESTTYEKVNTPPTPSQAENGVIYLVENSSGGYDQYIKVGDEVLRLGSTDQIDLTTYYNKTETDALLDTKANISDIPVKVSELTNDTGYVTKSVSNLQYYTKTTDLNNALNLKADKTEIPTKVSQLTNDSGYVTKSVNDLTNYTKTADMNTALNLKADKSTTYTKTETDTKLDLKADKTEIPTKVSQLTNDSGYVTKSVNYLDNYININDMNLNYYTKTEIDTKLGDYYTETEVDDKLDLKADKSAVTPSGGIIQFAGSTAPDGWLLCQGQAVSRTTYSSLFTAIGTTYGSGDGSTTFNLPNLKGKIPVGCDSTDTDFNTLGKTGGEKTHQLTKAEQPKVTGAFLGRLFGSSQTNIIGDSSTDREVFKLSFTGDRWTKYINANDANATKDTAKISFDNQGNDEAHNNLQPYITMNYIIKT